jgi:S-adenosylmethionine hydrolase
MRTDSLRPVALLTDFGLADPYAGQLRAVLARLAPGVALLDVSHSVEPFAVSQAAFFLAASAPFYPPDAVFLCVVDPGVGSTRRIVGASAGGQDFIAPDNGLLGLLLSTPGLTPPKIYDLTREASRYAASATFHGRDIIAPMVARLASGESLADFGQELPPGELARPDWAEPKRRADGLEVHVLHVDRYGNCLLSVRKDYALPAPVTQVRLPWGQRRAVAQVRIYSELPPDTVGLLAGSQGFLELAVNQSSGAEALGLRRGDQLRLIWTE